MPELPEIEAWVRELDGPVSATPVLRAGPAHIATLKTFDPPLATLEGRRLAGARRRGKHLLFPTDDGELVLRIHLMSAGRLRHLRAGAKGPKSPAFRLAFEDGSELVLTEAGSKKRAGVWLETPATTEAELAHLGPDALEVDAARLREILSADNRRLHPLLRDQRALAGIGRAHANEILWRAGLSPFALSTQLDDEQVERLAAVDPRGPGARARAAPARQGRQGRLPRPPPARRALPARPRCLERRADRAGRLRGAHGLLLPGLPDGRPRPEGPPALAPPALAVERGTVPRTRPDAPWFATAVPAVGDTARRSRIVSSQRHRALHASSRATATRSTTTTRRHAARASAASSSRAASPRGC